MFHKFQPYPKTLGGKKTLHHLKNVLSANVSGHFANMLGQFSKRFLLINGLEKELCSCLPDFSLSWLKEQGLCVELISFSCAAKMVMPWD